MKKKESRLAQIVHLLQDHLGVLSVNELASLLKVSEMTIRRDLNELQELNLIVRSHGRAALTTSHNMRNFQNIENDYALPAESEKMQKEKCRIGKFAASLINEGDIIIIDSGSTTDCMVNYFPKDIHLTAACCNLNIVQKLYKHPNIDILLSGGRLHQRDLMFESSEGINFLRTIRANKAFISASGVHEHLGLTCALNYEVISKQTQLHSAMQKILLVDSSKFGTVKTVYFANLTEIDTIITDNGIPGEWVEIIRNMDIKLHVV